MIPTLQLGQLGRAQVGIFVAVPPPLDGFTSGLWGAYGLQRMLTSYTGALIRVRRSVDSAEQDIGYDGTNVIDVQALLSFIGAVNGLIVRWYDQSGSANHISQTSSVSAQPTIVSSGAYVTDGVYFDNTTDWLLADNNSSGSNTAFSVFMAGMLYNTTGTQIFLEHNSVDTTHGAIAYLTGAHIQMGIANNFAVQAKYMDFNSEAWQAQKVLGFRFDRTQAAIADNVVLFVNGSEQSGSVNTNNGTLTGNFPAAKWNIGSRNGSNFAAMYLKRMAIYESAKSDGDMTSISTALA